MTGTSREAWPRPQLSGEINTCPNQIGLPATTLIIWYLFFFISTRDLLIDHIYLPATIKVPYSYLLPVAAFYQSVIRVTCMMHNGLLRNAGYK